MVIYYSQPRFPKQQILMIQLRRRKMGRRMRIWRQTSLKKRRCHKKPSSMLVGGIQATIFAYR